MIEANKLKLIIYEIYPNYKKIDSLIPALNTIWRLMAIA